MIDKIKTKNLILYFTNRIRATDLGKTKLYKLVFFVDSLSFKELGKTITGDKYLKFPMGPVPASVSGILHEMSEEGSLAIETTLKLNYFITIYKPLRQPDMSVFTIKERQIIEEISNTMSKKTRKELIELSHEKASWLKAEDYQELDFSSDIGTSPSPERFVKEYKRDIEILANE